MATPGTPPARRALLRGAAWAAPVALAAAAAPAVAASPPERTVTANRPSSTSASSEGTLWSVPEGVTQIHVEVVGAGGGGSGSSEGGSGALITGQLAVTPGQSVRMLVGAGGSRRPSSDERVAGGQGHGDGGSSPAFTGSSLELARGRGGSGGGCSSLTAFREGDER